MHIYAFGSVCRGEISIDSDIDLLVLTDGDGSAFNNDAYSVYSYARIKDLWKEGNPFAWHLFYESKLIFSSDGSDYLKSIRSPGEYKGFCNDFHKFFTLLTESMNRIVNGSNSVVFELSNIFLSIRNISICYSLAFYKEPIFSRHAAKLLINNAICIDPYAYRILERSRILSTRGVGDNISTNELKAVMAQFPYIQSWVLSMQDGGGRDV